MTEEKWLATLSTTEPYNNRGLFKLRRNNENSEVMRVRLTKNSKLYDLTALKVFFVTHFTGKDNLKVPVQKEATVLNAKEGIFEFVFDEDCMQKTGRQEAYFEIYDYDKFLDATQNFTYEIISSSRNMKADFTPWIGTWEEAEKMLDEGTAKVLTDKTNNLELKKVDKVDYNKDFSNLSQNKADKEYVDAQFQSIVSGNPEVVSSLAELEKKYPNGTKGVFLSKENNHWYYWNSSTKKWTDGGLYTSKDIDVNSVENKHLKGLVDLQKIGTSKYIRTNINLFDFNQAVPGVIDDTGVFNLTNPKLFTSAYIAARANGKFVKNSTIGSQVSLFDSTFKFIGTARFNLNYLTIPSNSNIAYMRVTVDTSEGMTLDNFMLMSGWLLTSYYVPYKRVSLDSLRVLDRNLDKNSIKMNKLEEFYETRTYNLFDLRTVEPIEISSSGQMINHAYVFTSDYIQVRANGIYRKNRKEGWKVSFYDVSKNFIDSVEFRDYQIVVPDNEAIYYMRVSVDTNVIPLNRFMITEGMSERDYQPYSYTHFNNFRPTTIDLKYATNVKYSSTVNLFNNKSILNGYFGIDGTWVPKTSGGNVSTDYIPVLPNKTYSKNSKFGWEVVFHDEMKRYVSGVSSQGSTVTVPNDSRIRYMTWSIDSTIETNILNELMIVEGTNIPVNYIPFEKIKFDKTVQIDTDNLEPSFFEELKKEILNSISGVSGIAAGFSDTEPISGTWKLGDKIWNTNPKAGENVGWICVKDGTFGSNNPVFKMFGVISL